MPAKDVLVTQMYPNGRKNLVFLTFNQNLEMYVWESMSKAENGWKLGSLQKKKKEPFECKANSLKVQFQQEW